MARIPEARIGGVEGVHLGGRQTGSEWLGPHRLQSFAQCGTCEHSADLRSKALRYRVRQPGRGGDRIPGSAGEAGQPGLDQCRDVGRGRQAGLGRDPENAKPPAAVMRQRGEDGVEHESEPPGHQVSQRQRARLVGCVYQVAAGDLGRLCEARANHMRRGAGRPGAELLRPLFDPHPAEEGREIRRAIVGRHAERHGYAVDEGDAADGAFDIDGQAVE
jgi:hypothetical protein